MRSGFFLTFCIILTVLAGAGWSQDIVREDGAGGAFTSIQAAIDGGTNAVISVEQTNTGTLDEALSVTRGVTIQNDTGGNVILTSSTSHVINIEADVTVTVQGFEIADGAGAGVRVSATDATVTVNDCNIHDNDGFDIANWGDIQSAEILCEGSPNTLGPSDSEIAAFTTTLTINNCDIDSGTPEGPAIVTFFGTVNVNNSTVTAQAGTGGPFGIDQAVIGHGAGHLNIDNCFVRLTGLNDGYIITSLGYTSFLSDGSSGSQIDTLTIDRSLLRVETDQVVELQGVNQVSLGVGNPAIRMQSAFNNVILDLNGLGNSSSNAFFITESIADFNHCTILGDNSGSNQAGRRGITCDTGEDQTVRVSNTLFGNLGSAAAGNDSAINNSISVTYCHLWNNGANLGNLGSGGASNVTFDDPPFLNTRYEITNENPEFTDAALGSLIADPASVTDDFDELGVRPRGAANDKGAQEGFGSPGTTGADLWELYR
jgi:hypothetical protein